MQWKSPGLPHPKKARMSHPQVKIMPSCWRAPSVIRESTKNLFNKDKQSINNAILEVRKYYEILFKEKDPNARQFSLPETFWPNAPCNFMLSIKLETTIIFAYNQTYHN